MEHSDIIDKYVLGLLSDEEKNRFDILMEQNEEFRKNVSNVSLLSQGIRLNNLEEKAEMLNKYEAVLSNEENKKGTNRVVNLTFKRHFISIAAGFLLLVLGGFWFANLDDQYTEYYIDFPATDLVRSDKTDITYANAIDAYNRADYKLSEQLLSDIDSPSSAFFYRGISLMKLQDFNSAISSFEQYIDLSEKVSLPVHYYMALCLLKQGKTADARKMLDEVDVENTKFYSLSRRLDKELSK